MTTNVRPGGTHVDSHPGARPLAKRPRIAPRKSPRQARSAATVTAILDAAARVLGNVGYERASVNLIAEKAGVSVGSLYQYFPSKESLALAVMKRHVEAMTDVVQRDIGDLAMLPLDLAARGIVHRAVKAYALDPALRRVMAAEEPKLGALARSAEFDDLLREILTAYVEFHRDEVRPTDIRLAVRVAMTAVEAVVSQHLLDADRPADHDGALEGELTALVLGYFKKPER